MKKTNTSIRNKTKILEQFIEHRINWKRACEKLNICRSTLYEWRRRYIDEGVSGLKYKSNKPYTSPNAVSDDTKRKVFEFAKSKRYYTNYSEISRYLYSVGIRVSNVTVKKIWLEHGKGLKTRLKNGRTKTRVVKK